MSTKDSGPVFPCTTKEYVKMFQDQGTVAVDMQHPGISLRDLYAGMAMVGLLVAGPQSTTTGVSVQYAWTLAHNMIVEREKRS